MCLGLPLLLSIIAAPPPRPRLQARLPAAQQKTINPNDYQDGPLHCGPGRKAGRHLRRRHARAAGHQAALGPEARRRPAPKSSSTRRTLKRSRRKWPASKTCRSSASYTAALNGFSADADRGPGREARQGPRRPRGRTGHRERAGLLHHRLPEAQRANGTWNTKFGGEDGAGKGVVVGVIDSGYTPSSAFFAGERRASRSPANPSVGVPYRTADGKIAMLKSDGSTFEGECQTGDRVRRQRLQLQGPERPLLRRRLRGHCRAGRTALRRNCISPVDVGSHGTHTASTAAGNANVEAMVDGRSFGQHQRHRAGRQARPSTRSAGKTMTPTPAAATPQRPSTPSTRPSWTAWTS